MVVLLAVVLVCPLVCWLHVVLLSLLVLAVSRACPLLVVEVGR